MRSANIIVASAMAIGIWMPAAVAQQTGEGMVTTINRLGATITIQKIQSGTVGANLPAAEVFKVQDGSLLEPVHAGDIVSYSTVESGGVRTITKLERKKQ